MITHTERSLLDMLHKRYGADTGNGPRFVVAEHVRSAAGFGDTYSPSTGYQGLRTCDAMALDLWPSGGLRLHGFEIKCSRTDWKRELSDPAKAETFKQYCDHWWLVVADSSIVRGVELPDSWGLLVAGRTALRVGVRAPRLSSPLPLPRSLLACLLRSATGTAVRRERQRVLAEAPRCITCGRVLGSPSVLCTVDQCNNHSAQMGREARKLLR